ncbi:MAG TPA: outer membrane protein assembly factor BamA [Gammaproteobacteria bacterium]|nr:outer membrane protein assembly factor BamA [Gammaproteobacteria bacterium]
MPFLRALRLILAVLMIGAVLTPAFAADETFTVQNIEVHGLQRISTGTLYTYLPISVGDQVNAARIRNAIKALYQTGFFENIQMRRSGNTLIVDVKERPSIANFTIVGNKAIKTEDLDKSLKKVGLAKGRIFSRSVLKDAVQELNRAYFSHGKYSVKIDTHVRNIGNNRVDITINISEGVDTTIKSINIVGNTVFDDATLLDQFKLQPTHWFSLFQSSNKYVRETLSGDLESLRSYYMDRGYADFHINSVQITISPNHKHIYITINIHEGEVYKVRKIKFAGQLILPEKKLRQLVFAQPGMTFSMGRATASANLMGDVLGNKGFAFAKINPIPDVDRKTHQVDVTFYVQPGKRVYVRHINFNGMPDTDDVVFRRNMRQMEGTWLSNVDLKLSKFRLQNLRMVKDVKESTDPVPGSPDLVDLNYDLTARQAGKFIFAVGYSQYFGVSLNGQIQHNNFLGEGDIVNLSLYTSQISELYDISFTKPYATVNGVSRTTRLYYQHSSELILNSSPLDTKSYGLSLTYGIPMSEFDSFILGGSASNTDLVTNKFGSSQEYIDFASDPNNGDVYQTILGPAIRYRQLDLITGWTHRTLNRALFASRGNQQKFGLDIATPVSDVKYYQFSFESTDLVPIGGGFLYRLHAAVGLNKTYGDSHTVPPNEHFFVGGADTVRGYKGGYLGPLDSNGYPSGGNFEFYAQNEIIIPSILGVGGAGSPSSRFSFFVDAGNAFAEPGDFQFNKLYESFGVAGMFVTPLGVMKVSLGWPIGSAPDYAREVFQFTVAQPFD